MLAIEYRPKVLEDVCGQDVPVKIIRSILQRYNDSGKNNKMLPNCIIFTGAFGSGKTTLSRIMARYLNCDSGPLIACGECPNCKAIDADKFRDLIEIDAASNNGVSDVGAIQEMLNYAIQGKFRIITFDEAHRLSSAAWDKLLKTLEESRKNQMFIFATTDDQKIPDTVKSRSTSLKINTVSNTIAAKRIEFVAAAEGLYLEPEVATTIANISNGHLRDCMMMLDLTSSLAENKVVTLESVYISANLATLEMVSPFINFFVTRDRENLEKFVVAYDDSPVTLLRSCITALDSALTNVQDPVQLRDKLAIIEIFQQAVFDFQRHSMPTTMLMHYYHIFLSRQ